LLLAEIATLKGHGISAITFDAVAQTVRIFFDTIVTESVNQFVKAQDGEIMLRSHQLEDAHEQYQAATERLRAVSQSRLRMLRAVLHELRNALHCVAMGASALREEACLERRADIRTHLTENAERLQAVIDRLQRISKLLAGGVKPEFRKVDVPRLLNFLTAEHRPAAEGKGLRFELNNALEFEEVTSDPELLRQVASEMLANAIEFTREGFVLLEVGVEVRDRWVLSVTDSGRGMNEMQAQQIFSEFHSMENDHPSVHLGLVITRHLAHLLTGEMTFRSALGEGSRFEVNLPRA